MTANTQRKINLLQYETDLRNFEKRYGMSSAAFYQQFEAGQLGDAMDFFEWLGLFELWQDLQKKVHRHAAIG